MMWLVASFYVDPVEVREALIKRVKRVNTSDYSLFSLSWLGYVDGAKWDYTLSGSRYGNGSVTDSVLGIVSVDTIGSCIMPGTPVAFWVSVGTSDSGAVNDTGFIYFDGTLYSEGGVMVAKYNAASGDSWEAWDTCLTPLDVRFEISDIDGDSINDTAWVRSSTMQVTNATSTELATAVSPLYIGVWASSLASSYNIDSIIILEYDRHVFRINFGKLETHTDSVRQTFFMFGTPALDTTLYDIYHKVMVVNVAEKPSVGYSPVVIERDVVKVTYPERYTLSIYSATGRLINRFYGKGVNTYYLPGKKGVYFVVFRAKDRALVRPYVR